MTLALIPIVKSQSGNPELVKPAPLVKDAKILRPGEAILKSPSKTSVSGVRYRRPAGAFPAIFSYIVDNEDNKRFSGLMNTPHFFLMPYSKYTFQGTADGFDGASNFYWEYPTDNGQSVYYGKDFTMRFDLGYNHDAPIFHVDDGGSNYSYQMSGYRGESLDGHSFIVTDSIPSKIITSVECKSYMYMLLLSSKSFNSIGNYGSNTYTWIDWKSSQNLLPYANNDHAWFFGKNGGSVNGYRYDGIAQAFEKPEHPYRLKNIVAYVDNLTVTDPVKLTCNIYEMSEIPPYDDNNPVYLNVSPDRLIAYGEAWLTPETVNETKGLIFFELWGEIDGLPFLATPLVDHPILVTIEDYNDPEMSNLVDFTFGTSSDVTIDEGFGELAYVKCAPTDENGNINGDYQWTGLNNFFDTGDGMCKTGFTVFLDAELPYVAFKDTNEIGEYVFPKEGGVMKRQIDGNMVSGLDFYSSTPYDEDHIWEITDTTYCDLPSWLEINLSNVLNDQGEFSGIVHAEVIAKPLPDYGYDSIRDMTVRFWPEYAPYIDFKFIQKRESQAIPKRGDVNGDGEVTIKDVTALIDYLLSDDASSIILSNADVDANGIVNIADVTCLIDHLLSGSWPDDPVTPPEEHEWVDLGLPSGTLWATCNVGANSPEDYGDYFAWGETEPKEFYYWNTYKWCNSSNITLSKYCTDSSFGNNGFVDDKTELDPEDDAAYVNWGENWCMPTLIQQDELRMQCIWTWTTLNGVNGWLVTGPNGNSMFLPAAGMRTHRSLGGIGSNGRYWSRTLNSSHPDWVYNLYPTSTNVYQSHHQRCDGFTVRAVRNSQEPVELFQLSETEVNLEVGESKVIDILNGCGSYTIDGGTDCVSSIFNGNQLILTGLAEGTAELTVTDVTTQANASIYISVTDSDTIQFDHEWVDLGLPSGTLWATCNVGADSPEEYGDYFAWGETESKDYYDWSTYKWCNGSQNTLTKYCNLSSYGDNGFVDNKMELDPEDDAATVNWGSEWRMPTLAQQKELIDNCTSEWTQLNGVYGRLLTGPNENTLFLPAAGYRGEESLYGAGSYACYWPSSLYSSYPYAAYRLYFYWEYLSWSNYSRFYGFTTRAVRASQEPVEIRLSETEVTLEVGESKTVDILNGSGSYTVDGGTDCVSSTFNGNQLILTGISEGTAELIVTDVTTQANASIFVSVTDSDTIQTMTFTVNGVSFTMVKVEGGTFMMGATEDQGWYGYNQNSLPVHEVTLSTYYIGMTEVTQELWMAVMGENPSYHHGNLQYPVEYVSWNSCQTFLANLSSITGRQFRLPTEAEWEFAARGGIKTQGYKYSGSNDLNLVGWYMDNAFNGTSVVGAKMSNELGLFDMSGNVYEWCYDWYGEYSSEAQFNPTGPAEGTRHVHRGGGCNDGDSFSIISCRDGWGISPQYGSSQIGLRLALQYE